MYAIVSPKAGLDDHGGEAALLSMALAIFLVLYPVPAAAQIVSRRDMRRAEGQIPIRDVIAEFEAENPGVQVQLEQVDDYKPRIIVQIAGGVGPDVYMVGDWDYAEFAPKGVGSTSRPLPSTRRRRPGDVHPAASRKPPLHRRQHLHVAERLLYTGRLLQQGPF